MIICTQIFFFSFLPPNTATYTYPQNIHRLPRWWNNERELYLTKGFLPANDELVRILKMIQYMSMKQSE